MRSRTKWLLLVLLIGGVGFHWVQLKSWAQDTDEDPFGVVSDQATDDDPFSVASDGEAADDEELKAAREEAAEVAKERARDAQRRAAEAYKEVEMLRLRLSEAEARAQSASTERKGNAEERARRRMQETEMRADAAMKEVEMLRRRLLEAEVRAVEAAENRETNTYTTSKSEKEDRSAGSGPGKTGGVDVREDMIFHFPPSSAPVQLHATTIMGGGGGPHVLPHQIREAAKMTVDAKNGDEKQQAHENLGGLLDQYFERDLERREEELAKIEERLAKLRELVEKRREKKEEIIDLQRKVALNEAAGLGFYHEAAPGGPFWVVPDSSPGPIRVPLPPAIGTPPTPPKPPAPPTPAIFQPQPQPRPVQ